MDKKYNFDLESRTLNRMIAMVYTLTGVTMEERKRRLLSTRLRPRLRELAILSFDDYLDYIEENASERNIFIDRVTTHETHFFRTPQIWKSIEEHALPRSGSNEIRETYRVWSAASSIGLEPYSLLMLLARHKTQYDSFSFSMTASDVSNEMVESTRAGIFEKRHLDEIKSDYKLLVKEYSQLTGTTLTIQSNLKSQLHVFQHNLLWGPIRNRFFKLVLLRNVLIYFSPTDKEKVIAHMHASLMPGGYLALGESESLSGIPNGFEYVCPLLYRKPVS